MNQEEFIQRSKSSKRKYLIFSLPNLSTSIIIGFADFALFTLYKLAYLPNTFLIGTALALGKLTIAGSQFFFGWISDAKYTKWGRRKPYLIILSPVLSISFFFLLLPGLMIEISNSNSVFIWLLIWSILFNLSYGVTTPYGSWMAEQFNVSDRPKTAQYYNIFAFVGSTITSLFSFLILTGSIDAINANPNVVPPEILYSVVLFSILPILLFYITTFLMPTEPHFKIESKMFENLKTILKNKNFILVTLMQGIASVGFIMVGQTILQFTEIVLQFGDTDYYIVAGIMLFGIPAFIYIWRRTLQKLGKKRCLLYIFLAAIVFLPTTLFGAIPMDSYLIYGILFVLGLAASMGGWFLLPSIIYADIAEDDQKTTGELKAGIYTGFPSITLNIFQALGLFLIGIILDLPNLGLGYSIGYVLWGPVCSLVLIIAYLYSRRFIQLDFEWEKKIE